MLASISSVVSGVALAAATDPTFLLALLTLAVLIPGCHHHVHLGPGEAPDQGRRFRIQAGMQRHLQRRRSAHWHPLLRRLWHAPRPQPAPWDTQQRRRGTPRRAAAGAAGRQLAARVAGAGQGLPARPVLLRAQLQLLHELRPIQHEVLRRERAAGGRDGLRVRSHWHGCAPGAAGPAATAAGGRGAPAWQLRCWRQQCAPVPGPLCAAALLPPVSSIYG
jgi:hypothetical protein